MELATFFEEFDHIADAPGAVAKMRELVLQLAVRGELSAPVADDEPVEELLRRIWNDHTGRHAVSGGKRLSPFDLPGHWRWVALSEVAEFSIGKTPPRGDPAYWDQGEYSWVSIADMKHYGVITETKERVSARAARAVFGDRFVEPGSILMSFKLTIGKIARTQVPCFHNEAIASLLPPEPDLADYLFRFLPVFAAL